MSDKAGSNGNGNGAKHGKARRQREYDPKVANLLVDMLTSGCLPKDALRALPLSVAAVTSWRRQHPEFAEKLETAEARCMARHVAIITDAGQNDWRASAWFVEHRAPENWSMRRIDKTAQINIGETGLSVHIHLDNGPDGRPLQEIWAEEREQRERELAPAHKLGMSHPLPIPDLVERLPAAAMPSDEEIALATGARPRPRQKRRTP